MELVSVDEGDDEMRVLCNSESTETKSLLVSVRPSACPRSRAYGPSVSKLCIHRGPTR